MTDQATAAEATETETVERTPEVVQAEITAKEGMIAQGTAALPEAKEALKLSKAAVKQAKKNAEIAAKALVEAGEEDDAEALEAAATEATATVGQAESAVAATEEQVVKITKFLKDSKAELRKLKSEQKKLEKKASGPSVNRETRIWVNGNGTEKTLVKPQPDSNGGKIWAMADMILETMGRVASVAEINAYCEAVGIPKGTAVALFTRWKLWYDNKDTFSSTAESWTEIGVTLPDHFGTIAAGFAAELEKKAAEKAEAAAKKAAEKAEADQKKAEAKAAAAEAKAAAEAEAAAAEAAAQEAAEAAEPVEA